MPSFDWEPFLTRHSIPFVRGGVNQNRRQLGVRCPMCGAADPSQHLSLNPTGSWSCRRNNQHWGSDPARLISLLMGIPLDHARRLVGPEAPARLVRNDTLTDEVARMLGVRQRRTTPQALPMPREFRPVVNSGLSRAYFGYLVHERGYTDHEAQDLCRIYDLRYSTEGLFAGRITIPVFDQDGLASWTGRALSQHEELRYLSLSQDLADRYYGIDWPVKNIHDLVLNEQDLAMGGDILVIGEGPFDGIALDYCARQMKSRGSCLFSKSVSRAQRDFLISIAPRYRRRIILLDPDAELDQLGLAQQLAAGGYMFAKLPTNKDPAATDKRLLSQFLNSLRVW